MPGVATGLAVTGLGGDVLFIEATAVDGTSTGSGKGGLTLTGQLGDVMKESAQIACPTSARTPTELGIADRRSSIDISTSTCRPVRCRRTDRLRA